MGGDQRGYDGAKKVKGRKRHLLVDTQGSVLGSLSEWLEKPRKSFGYGQPEGQPFAAILEEARKSKALPQEKRPETIGIKHPGHTAARGPVPDWLAPALKR